METIVDFLFEERSAGAFLVDLIEIFNSIVELIIQDAREYCVSVWRCLFDPS